MNKSGGKELPALIIIDVQQGLFEKLTPIYQAERFLENLDLLIESARQAGVPVIYIQHSNNKTLIKGSDAWRLHPAIQPLDGEDVIHKLHGDAFIDTNLHEILQASNVNVLVLTGLVTHGCVRATSLGAIKKGYQVILISDGHSNFSKDAPGLIEKWNRTLSEKGAQIVATREVQFETG